MLSNIIVLEFKKSKPIFCLNLKRPKDHELDTILNDYIDDFTLKKIK